MLLWRQSPWRPRSHTVSWSVQAGSTENPHSYGSLTGCSISSVVLKLGICDEYNSVNCQTPSLRKTVTIIKKKNNNNNKQKGKKKTKPLVCPRFQEQKQKSILPFCTTDKYCSIEYEQADSTKQQLLREFCQKDFGIFVFCTTFTDLI